MTKQNLVLTAGVLKQIFLILKHCFAPKRLKATSNGVDRGKLVMQFSLKRQ